MDGRSPYERIFALASSEPDSFLRDKDYVEEPGRPLKTLAIESSELLEELHNRAERLVDTTRWGTAQLVVRVITAKNGRKSFVSSLSPKSETVLTAKSLNRLIVKKGYNWSAGVTSLSELSDPELRTLCGAKDVVDKGALRRHLITKDVRGSLESDKATRPMQWDWRNVNGKDWTTPIRRQMSCGSCVAFAVAAAVEMNYQIARKKAHSGIQLSVGQLFSCGCGRCCRTGWGCVEALEFVKYEGLVAESDYPYRPINQDCGVGLCPSSGDQHSKIKISKWFAMRDAENAKTWLSLHGPLATTMYVFKDFASYKGGVYTREWWQNGWPRHRGSGIR